MKYEKVPFILKIPQDYESSSLKTYSILIQASDGAGESSQATYTIKLTDAIEKSHLVFPIIEVNENVGLYYFNWSH